MLTVDERNVLIKKIRDLPRQVAELVRDLPADDLEMVYLPGEWSVAQNVHHLADAHMNAFYRFKNILLHDQPEIRPFDQKSWSRTVEATLPNVEDSIFILRGLHNRWTTLMDSVGEEDWDRRGLHNQVGVVTLEDLLMSYARHGDNHLEQIKKTLDARDQHRKSDS